MVNIINSFVAVDVLRVHMAHRRTSLTEAPRRRQRLELTLMTLFGFLATMNGENLDVATDPDQTTDEFAVENSAGFHGKLTTTIYAASQ